MGSYSAEKLSLLLQFDDLKRHTEVLTRGCEREIRSFVENQKKLLEKVKKLQLENELLQNEKETIKKEKNALEIRYDHAKELLKSKDRREKRLQEEKNSLERQISLIKELLTCDPGFNNQTKEKLVQLSEAAQRMSTIQESGSLSFSDCDETNDDLDTEMKPGRLSSQNLHNSNDPYEKRRKSDEKMGYLEVDVFSPQDGTATRQSSVTLRSSSEPSFSYPEEPISRHVIRSDSEQLKVHYSDIKRNNSIQGRQSLPIGRYSNGGKLSRSHNFVSKFFIRSEKCHPCGKIIKFCKQELKCTGCRINCHSECKDQCPLPCILVVTTPSKGSLYTLADFTSSTSPMIPSLIAHCINEIESRGLEDIGLYRVSGSEKVVKDLKEKFLRGKTIPSLNNIDIHAICGTVKEFLRSLKDSLVPKSAWHVFADATDCANQNVKLDALCDAINNLPQPNKETLAFLILHLQRIAASPMCKMPISNLAKVFGPTVVGHSVDEPAASLLLSETKPQRVVMESLLSISTDFWQNILICDSNTFIKLKTPECLPVPVTSRLGPIYSSNQLSKNITPVMKTNLSPRTTRDGTRNSRRQFFTSPFL